MTNPKPTQVVPDVRLSEALRLRACVEAQFDFVGRFVRSLGVADADIEDITQAVFQVLASRLCDIEPGKERAFVAGTAVRLAANARRGRARAREVGVADLPEIVDGGPSPEELVDQRRALDLLDRVLAAMDLELRSVLVLFEAEEMTTAEIAAALQIPQGTVASRLRRAREDFVARLRRMGVVVTGTKSLR